MNERTKFYLTFDNQKIAITKKGLELSEMLHEWVYMQHDDERYFNATTNEYVIPLTSVPALAQAKIDDIRRFAQVCDGVLPLDEIETLDLVPLIVLADFYRATRVESLLFKPTRLKEREGWERIGRILEKKTVIKPGTLKTILTHDPRRDVLCSLQQELIQRFLKNTKGHYSTFCQGTGLLWTMIQRLPGHVLNELKESIFIEQQTPIQLGVNNHNISVLAKLSGGLLAVGLMDKQAMMIIDLNDYTKKPLEIKLSDYVYSFAVSPDNILFVGLGDGAIEAWNTQDFKQKPTRWIAHTGASRNTVLSLLVLSNNKLVSGSMDGALKLWDFQKVGQPPVVLRGHKGAVCALAELSGDLFVSAAFDAMVRGWDQSSFKKDHAEAQAEKLNINVRAMVALPDDRLAVGTQAGEVSIYDFHDLKKAPVKIGANGEFIYAVSIVAEKMLAVGDHAGVVRLWDMDNLPKKPIKLSCSREKAYVSSIQSLPDGFMMTGLSLPAQGGLDKQPRVAHPLLLWDLFTGLTFEQTALVLAVREDVPSLKSKVKNLITSRHDIYDLIFNDDRLVTLFASLPDHEIQELKKMKGPGIVQPKMVRATIKRLLDGVENDFKRQKESQQAFENYEERLDTVGNLFHILDAKLDDWSDPLITQYSTVYHAIKNDTKNEKE